MKHVALAGYHIEGALGSGAMGTVHRARDVRDGRAVALKVVRAAADAVCRRRFAREVDALRRLSHPNVVQLIAAGEVQGVPYAALELLEGGSLEDRLRRDGPLAPREAARVVLGLARALVQAHRLGLVHRDLKPANVLFDRDGTPKLADFGVVKDLEFGWSRLSLSGGLVGSPGFLAPEQVTGGPGAIGPWTDIHGLGAVLYAALTGEPPVVGADLHEVLVATMSRIPDPPSRLRRGIPPALDALCLRCLAKTPSERPLSCGALVSDLEAYLAPPSRRCRRRRWILSLSLAAGVLAGGLLALSRPGRRLGGAPELPTPTFVSSSAVGTPEGPGTLAIADHVRRGQACLRRGELAEAIVAFDDALALEPHDVDALLGRGGALMRMVVPAEIISGERRLRADAREGLAAALADFTAVLEVDPTHAAAWCQRGEVHHALGDLAAAIADYSAAISADPRRTAALVNRGVARVQKGDFVEALDDYGRAAKLMPRHPVLLANSASLLLALGRATDAEALATAAITAKPDLAAAWTNRAAARSLKGDLRGALADYVRARDLERERGSAWTGVAEAHRVIGDLDAALEDYGRAIELDPDAAGPRAGRALVHLARNDLTAAGEDTEAAVAFDPEAVEPWAARALVREAAGDVAGAAADLARWQALERDPVKRAASTDHDLRQRAGEALAAASGIEGLRRLVVAAPHELSWRALLAIRLLPERSLELEATVTERSLELEAAGHVRAVLEAGEASPGARALALYARSILRGRLGDYDGSLADTDAALGLRDLALFRHQRSFLRTLSGDLAGAGEDAAAGIRQGRGLEPRKLGELYFMRARARENVGDPDAASDYTDAARFLPEGHPWRAESVAASRRRRRTE